MTTANDLPLLAMLGKGTAMPDTPLAAAGDDDRALDAALEFAALLLDAGVAGEAGGKTLPVDGGKALPVQDDVPAAPADAVPADVLEPIIRREPPDALGDAVADQIRTAQAQPAVLQGASAETRDAAPLAEQAPAPGLPPVPGLAPATSGTQAPATAAVDADASASARARRAARVVAANASASSTRGTAAAPTAGADSASVTAPAAAEVAEPVAGAPRERAAPAPGETMPALATLARVEAARKSGRTAADPARRALDAVSAIRTEPLAGGATPLAREGTAMTSAASGPVPQLAGPDALLGETGWTRQFAERVGWVIQARVPQAQLSLNPEHLGPIEMSIEVDDAKARVQFTAAHAVTREAIEQSLPRLREMLEQQGLDLAQADVGADPNTARGNGAGDPDADRDVDAAEAHVADAEGDDTDPDGAGVEHVVRLRPRGLVDTFV